MAKKDLKDIVVRIVDLPTLPQVVTRIMGLIEDPNSSVKDINNVMSNDPALVAKILKLVNSSFYGLPNKVSSIHQAIAILGYNTVKSLAISASVFDLFGEGEDRFSYADFWTHSIGTATVASIIARQKHAVDQDTAFVVGLLHGMGKLVLDQYAPVEFATILDVAAEEERSFGDAEKEVLDTGYEEIGYWLAERWQLAEEVQYAILYQNQIAECPEEHKRLAALVAFSSYVCRIKQYGANGDHDKPSLPRAAWDALLLKKAELPEIINLINHEMHRAESFLSLIQGD